MSHQGAERAVKSIAYGLGDRTVLGHSVVELIRRYSDWAPALKCLLHGARALDLFYIPTRYPNSLPGGLGSEAFSMEQATEGLDLSEPFLIVANEFQASGSAMSCQAAVDRIEGSEGGLSGAARNGQAHDSTH